MVTKKKQPLLQKFRNPKILVLTIFVLGFGAFGVYKIAFSSAATYCTSGNYGYGQSGTCVKYIQTMLNYHFSGLSRNYLVEDGKFGTKTKAAVVRLQKERGLVQDGIVGKNTWIRVCQPNKGPAPSWFNNAYYAAGCNIRGGV